MRFSVSTAALTHCRLLSFAPSSVTWIIGADARRNHADSYRSRFNARKVNPLVTCPPAPPATFNPVYDQFTIRCPFRDELREFLRQSGVPSEIYYPLCLHLQTAFSYLGHTTGEFPVAEKASKEVLSLPVFPELSDAQQSMVVKAIADFCATKNAV
jgi:dTDP-4-amino-4,6-dideoxygalactose transaminase